MFTRLNPDPKAQPTDAAATAHEQEIPAFAPVTERNTHTRSHPSSYQEIRHGERLFEQWKKCDEVYQLREGLVKLVYSDENGSQVTLGLRSAGWFAGAAETLLGMPHIYSVVAVSDCKMSCLPAADFFEWTTKNVKKLHQVMKSLALDSVMQAKLHAEIHSHSAAERLEHFMQERGGNDPHWATIDPLPLLKQGELAQLLAVSPEHLCRLRAVRPPSR